jgi:N-acyl-D-amino-acid deacylase
MGNCGFSLAPASYEQRDLVLTNLERAEDIPRAAMATIDWSWDSFRSYLETIDRLPKGINYAAYIGHSALRTWVMGERALDSAATDDDLTAMQCELRDALRAGAIGFSSSRGTHETVDGRPVASRVAKWSEVTGLVGVLGELGTGIFEIATIGYPEMADLSPEASSEECLAPLGELALKTGVPITFSLVQLPDSVKRSTWKEVLRFIEQTNQRGADVFGSVSCREISTLLSFQTRLPFDDLEIWRDIRQLPIKDQRPLFERPEIRAQLVAAAANGTYSPAIGAEARKPDFDTLRIFDSVLPEIHERRRSVRQVAGDRGLDPVELMIMLALETDFTQFFLQPNANSDLRSVQEILLHPHTVMALSDAGAHASQIVDSSLPVILLAYWARARQVFSFEEAVRMLTLEPARRWGISDRGLIREGMKADLNVLDLDRLIPEMPTVAADMPGGAVRLVQKTKGIHATIVNGKVFMRDGVHTGEMSGRLLRGRLANGVRGQV